MGRYIPPALQPVPLTPEEQEELRKKEERKDRLHQNYLRARQTASRRNGKNATTPNARPGGGGKGRNPGEDMEKGIFTTVSQLPRQEPRKATVSASAAI